MATITCPLRAPANVHSRGIQVIEPKARRPNVPHKIIPAPLQHTVLTKSKVILDLREEVLIGLISPLRPRCHTCLLLVVGELLHRNHCIDIDIVGVYIIAMLCERCRRLYCVPAGCCYVWISRGQLQVNI
jgi:hypothetical protein